MVGIAHFPTIPTNILRMLITSAVKRICPQPCLPHSLSRGNLSGTPASDHSLEVVRQGPWLAAGVFALCLGNGNTLSLALKDIFALKLCDRREYGKHKLAGGRGCVDSLLTADKFHLLLGQPFHKVKQVAGIASETANGLNNYGVPLTDVIHHSSKFRAIGVLAAGLFDEYFVNAKLMQQDFLSGGVWSSVLTRM